MERHTQPECVSVWDKVMQKGRDAFSSILIGFTLQKSGSHWLAFAQCFVNRWPAVTWQFVDPIIIYNKYIIILCLCASVWMYVCASLYIVYAGHPVSQFLICIILALFIMMNEMFVF